MDFREFSQGQDPKIWDREIRFAGMLAWVGMACFISMAYFIGMAKTLYNWLTHIIGMQEQEIKQVIRHGMLRHEQLEQFISSLKNMASKYFKHEPFTFTVYSDNWLFIRIEQVDLEQLALYLEQNIFYELYLKSQLYVSPYHGFYYLCKIRIQ